ncbi:MAG: hypothetical protein HS103_00515 [Anaerolineales bacterium]|nr:hypothetical protein [Anaerolineales bacterium]
MAKTFPRLSTFITTRAASPEVFVGQDDAFALIRGYLAGAVPCVPLLIGSRKIGKTSILLNTPAHIERRYLPLTLIWAIWRRCGLR